MRSIDRNFNFAHYAKNVSKSYFQGLLRHRQWILDHLEPRMANHFSWVGHTRQLTLEKTKRVTASMIFQN